jgi:hypothetical protein
MASTDRQRWARVPPGLAWRRPGLPTHWTLVLERNPEAMNPDPLPGSVCSILPARFCMFLKSTWSSAAKERPLPKGKAEERRGN